MHARMLKILCIATPFRIYVLLPTTHDYWAINIIIILRFWAWYFSLSVCALKDIEKLPKNSGHYFLNILDERVGVIKFSRRKLFQTQFDERKQREHLRLSLDRLFYRSFYIFRFMLRQDYWTEYKSYSHCIHIHRYMDSSCGYRIRST